MNLKEMIAQDITSVFLNPAEFAESHNIEGLSVACILQGDISKNGELYADYSNLLIIPADKFPGKIRAGGDTLIVDNVIYTIQSIDNQAGVLFIALNAPEQY